MWCEPAFAEEEGLSVSARVDKSQVEQGEKLVFEVEVSGSFREAPKVRISGFGGFKVASSGQSQNIQINSGGMVHSLVLTYTLLPLKTGNLTIDPVAVEYQGKKYETKPVEVKVVPRLEGEVTL